MQGDKNNVTRLKDVVKMSSNRGNNSQLHKKCRFSCMWLVEAASVSEQCFYSDEPLPPVLFVSRVDRM